MIKILIPNGTGPSNIGDMAMLMVLKGLIQKSIPNAKIVIHSTEPYLYIKMGQPAKHTLYSYVAFANRNNFVRGARLARLCLYYLVFKFHWEEEAKYVVAGDKLFELCLDYKSSDSIIFVGGGYLRTKPGITQSLNLAMQLFMISFAKLFASKRIISPISFGPFAHPWQENLSASILRGIDLVSAREFVSYRKMKKNRIGNVILSSDHALLLDSRHHKKSKHQVKTIGFTLRRWFKGQRQERFELEVVGALAKFALENDYQVLPILQVDSPSFGEDDRGVSERVSQQLKLQDVKVRDTMKVTSLSSARDVYASLDLLLGMRMHSNIIAATQGVPFVAVSYEYKTEGIAKRINMQKYCIKSEEVNKNNLYQLLVDVNKNKKYIHAKLINSINAIQESELSKWGNFLSRGN